jgi:hypothetical protein
MVTGVNNKCPFNVWRCHGSIGNWPISLLEILKQVKITFQNTQKKLRF